MTQSRRRGSGRARAGHLAIIVAEGDHGTVQSEHDAIESSAARDLGEIVSRIRS